MDIPRDRNGSFDPVLIAKYQRRFPEFDTKIISMYARGMTTREIQGHIEEIYGIEASPSLISAITDAVIVNSLILIPAFLIRKYSLSSDQVRNMQNELRGR